MRVNRAWVMAAAVAAVVTATFFLFWPSASSLIEEWRDTGKTTYTHGSLIAGLVVWLLLRNRDQIAHETVEPDGRAAVALILVSVAWLIAVRAGIEVAHQLLLPALMWLATCAVLGLRIALASTVPIGYLVFAIPVWDQVNGVLQAATVAANDLLLRVTSVPAFVDGNMVHLASGVFEIEGGCSGLHFFIVGLALATLYGEVNRDTPKVRVQLIALALFLSLLSNWLRVYTIIVAGYLTNMQHYLVRVEHYRFGWAVFAVMMVIFFTASSRFPAAPERDTANPPERDEALSMRALGSRIGMACLALILVPAWLWLDPVRPATLPAPTSLLPMQPLGWSGPSRDAIAWSPVFNGSDLAVRGAYVGHGSRVEMYVAAYATQAQDKELIGYGNSVVGSGEEVVMSRSHIDTMGPAVELVVESGRQRAVIWYAYQIGELRTNRDIVAQLVYGLRALFDSPLVKIVALRSECSADCDAARAALRGFCSVVVTGNSRT